MNQGWINSRFQSSDDKNKHGLDMIKVESGSDSFTLVFKGTPVLKVSTRQPYIELGDNTADNNTESRQAEAEPNNNSGRHSFQIIE